MARKEQRYAVLVRPLAEEDGGGWLAVVPDLPGCVSDGETPQEAIRNVQGAIESWLEAAEENGRPVPVPGAARGEWRQRVPRTIHAALTEMAKSEGVSLNMLVASVLAEYVGRREKLSLQPSDDPNPSRSSSEGHGLELVTKD